MGLAGHSVSELLNIAVDPWPPGFESRPGEMGRESTVQLPGSTLGAGQFGE